MSTLDLFREFSLDANEQFDKIEQCILMLEKGYSDEEMDVMMRAFHTLKGNATIMGFVNIRTLSHNVESMLGDIRAAAIPMSSASADLILKAVDSLKRMIGTANQSAETHLNPAILITEITDYRDKMKRMAPVAAEKLKIKRVDDLAILEFPASTGHVRKNDLIGLLRSLRSLGVARFVFDFSAVTIFLPDEIAMFVSVMREVENLGAAVRSCNVNDQILRVLRAVGKETEMNVTSQLKDAIDSFG